MDCVKSSVESALRLGCKWLGVNEATWNGWLYGGALDRARSVIQCWRLKGLGIFEMAMT